jgi:hypothetical protein
MTSEPISLGGKLFVPIQPPVQPSAARSANPNLRIRRSLEAAGFKMTGDPISLGGKLFAGLHPRSLNKDASVVTPSLSPPVALPAAVKRDGKSLEAAGFQLPESIQSGGNQFVVLRRNRIVFVPSLGGWSAAAQSKFPPAALLNTYESIVETLARARVVVGQNADIAAKVLQEHFRDSYLHLAAGPRHWEQFADAFRPAPQRSQNGKHSAHPDWKMSTPESVALDFLARTTLMKPGYITKVLSHARTARKPKKHQKVSMGKLE